MFLSIPQSEVDSNEILNNIISITTNDVILFCIVIFISLSILLTPTLLVISKMKKDLRSDETNKTKMILDVINRNTEAFGDLRTTLFENNASTTAILKSINSDSKETRNIIISLSAQQESIDNKINIVLHDCDQLKTIAQDADNKYNEIMQIEKNIKTNLIDKN